jgi:hypothetical protein
MPARLHPRVSCDADRYAGVRRCGVTRKLTSSVLWMMMSEIASDADDAELYGRVAPELIRFATALVGRVDAPDVLSGAVVRRWRRPVGEAEQRLDLECSMVRGMQASPDGFRAAVAYEGSRSSRSFDDMPEVRLAVVELPDGAVGHDQLLGHNVDWRAGGCPPHAPTHRLPGHGLGRRVLRAGSDGRSRRELRRPGRGDDPGRLRPDPATSALTGRCPICR